MRVDEKVKLRDFMANDVASFYESCVTYIRDYKGPCEIFHVRELEEWARSNGWRKEDE